MPATSDDLTLSSHQCFVQNTGANIQRPPHSAMDGLSHPLISYHSTPTKPCKRNDSAQKEGLVGAQREKNSKKAERRISIGAVENRGSRMNREDVKIESHVDLLRRQLDWLGRKNMYRNN
ncbi:hypothetical protein TNCV_4649371 [Trichonephila clavipes]|uniref:Uncharacterized protein n=1 Tax=Trichonephila clavipes TaxID=2585209 RepID=A0A8X6T272_TRICX|nr:hypothetical protein TNCV_4649371 [Trichonephila clavipes]